MRSPAAPLRDIVSIEGGSSSNGCTDDGGPDDIRRTRLMSQRTIVLVALALTIAAPCAASAQTEPTSPIPDVRTTATAERSVRPDVATFSLSFNASGRTPLAAGQAVAARADSIRRSLIRLGIPRDSLVSGY